MGMWSILSSLQFEKIACLFLTIVCALKTVPPIFHTYTVTTPVFFFLRWVKPELLFPTSHSSWFNEQRRIAEKEECPLPSQFFPSLGMVFSISRNSFFPFPRTFFFIPENSGDLNRDPPKHEENLLNKSLSFCIL